MKKLFALALSLLLAFSLVACGTTPAEETKLTYWSMWSETEPQGMVISEAIEAFTESTGIKVDVQWGARETRKTLLPALESGEIIDVFDEDIERVLGSWGKYLLPLDTYAADTYDDTAGKPYRDSLNNTLMTLVEELGAKAGLGDGKLYNIPYQPSTFVVMYNKDLFDAAGIKSVPKTWDEFIEVCAALKENDVTGITVDDAYMAALFGYNMDRLIGAEATNKMVEDMDFSNPGVLRFAEIWADMATKGYVSQKAATNIYPDGQTKEIATGEVAMYLNGTWLPNEIKGINPDINWGSFAWPAMDEAGDGIEANNYSAQSFAIHKDTKYPDAAFAFIRWLTLGEWDQKLAADTLGVPISNDATWPKELAEAKTIIDNTTLRLNWAVGMEDKAEVNTAIKENFPKLITGKMTPEEFAEAIKNGV